MVSNEIASNVINSPLEVFFSSAQSTSHEIHDAKTTNLQFSPQLALVTSNTVHDSGDVPEVSSEFGLQFRTVVDYMQIFCYRITLPITI